MSIEKIKITHFLKQKTSTLKFLEIDKLYPSKKMQIRFTKKESGPIDYKDFFQFSISKKGDCIWTGYTVKNDFFKIVCIKLNTGKLFFYDYEHKYTVYIIEAVEEFNLLISGGIDQKLILHDLESGRTLKVFDLKISLFNSKRVKNMMVISTKRHIYFFDLRKKLFLRKEEDYISFSASWAKMINFFVSSTADFGSDLYIIFRDSHKAQILKVKIPKDMHFLIYELFQKPFSIEKNMIKKKLKN